MEFFYPSQGYVMCDISRLSDRIRVKDLVKECKGTLEGNTPPIMLVELESCDAFTINKVCKLNYK